MSCAISQFRAALASRKIIPPERIVADSKMHRADVEGTGGRQDASYLLRDDGSGGFQNHKDGLGWADWFPQSERSLSPEEKVTRKKRIAKAETARSEARAARQMEAAARARELWESASPADGSHPYLLNKGVKPYGIREKEGNLLIPLRTGIELHSLQTIFPDGQKRFLAGGKTGDCYYSIGRPVDAHVLCIVEGFATGASIHEATGYPVAIAFTATNLRPVAMTMKKLFPDMTLIICGDDDYQTEGNPGVTQAKKAARAVKGFVAVPEFGESRPDGASDFNDLHRHRGADAVRANIREALGQAESQNADSTVNSGKKRHHSKNRELKEGQHAHGNGYFEVTEKGVFFVETDRDGKATSQWVCSRLEILAMTRDSRSSEWGRLLQWSDRDGTKHTWAMPMELLQGDSNEFRKELARGGLEISPGIKAKNLLSSYIQVFSVERRARCVEKLGWHNGVYVTPSAAIGKTDEIVVFQNASAVEPAFASSGTVEAWRGTVARLARGNSRIMFALSVSFAAVLADLVGEDSGGFHFRGSSSSGKTTALRAAASVWGRPSTYARLWRATANGLEGLAALHNDGVLILDELSQIDPKEAGEAAYLLANGQGKTRAHARVALRKTASWRLLFLSAGEESLAALMLRAGLKTNAGQETRLADMDSDAGKGMGIFEVLHEYATPAMLSVALRETSGRLHGAVGLKWLEYVAAERQSLIEPLISDIRRFTDRYVTAGSSGQVQRVARRFALVAVAGELATRYGLTGWDKGEAVKASGRCFLSWLDNYGGTGDKEVLNLLSQVRMIFERYGSSRFEDLNSLDVQRIPDRLGYRNDSEFWVMPETFAREICKGFDHKFAVRILKDKGWLITGKDKSSQSKTIPGQGKRRVYVFSDLVLEGSDES